MSSGGPGDELIDEGPHALHLYYTCAEVARMLRVHVSKVSRWISSGDLQAVNVAKSNRGRKGRWRISQEDLDAFLAARRSQAPVAKPTKRRMPPVTQYV